MIIDTHCHLDFQQFDHDRDQVLLRAAQAGLRAMITVGTDCATSRASCDLAERYPAVYASVGIHPHYVAAATPEAMAQIRGLTRRPRVVAIGETGLDFYNRADPHQPLAETLRQEQTRVLREHLEIACACALPVILHCRSAGDAMAEMIRAYAGRGVRGVMHCFSESRALLRVCLDAGLYVSLTANITFASAGNIRALIPEIPQERLLVETDAPFLAARRYRGQRNEPAYLGEVVAEIARITGTADETIAAVTAANARKLFGLPE